RVPGVLDRVVQQCRCDRPRTEPEFGEDLRHRERVGDVWLAALALLAGVLVACDQVRAFDDREIALGVIGPDRSRQVVQVVDAWRTREDARHEPAQTRPLLGLDIRLRHGTHLPWTTPSYAG